MASSRHALFLTAAVAAAALMVAVPATAAGLTTAQVAAAAAPWTWTWSEASDDESCWGDPKECPVVYDVGVGGGGGGVDDEWRRGRRLQNSDDIDAEEDLLPTPYISYTALARDTVPCSVPGASYYNCEPGAEANPYTRGCSAIAQCRD
ncbi:hypothetical protein ACP70R_012400 [Stipagrostis hirtigluma subsp. patula]